MSRSSQTPYLRLVEAQTRETMNRSCTDVDGTLLGFVDMSSVSDEGFETILARVQPSWVFDLRPVPYFDIGRLNRKRVFDLFSSHCASYRDVAGWLQITEYNDASLNSGAVARYLSETLSIRPCHTPILVLVDDDEILDHALRVLPHHLESSFAYWCAFALETTTRDGNYDLILRTAAGEAISLQAKWLGDRDLASARLVESFRLWLGDDMFAVDCAFDDGRAAQVAMPLPAAGLLEQHLDAALARIFATPHHVGLSKAFDHVAATKRDRGEPMHVVARQVDAVHVRESHDGRTILITFGHSEAERTHAIFTVEGAERLRGQLQLLIRR